MRAHPCPNRNASGDPPAHRSAGIPARIAMRETTIPPTLSTATHHTHTRSTTGDEHAPTRRTSGACADHPRRHAPLRLEAHLHRPRRDRVRHDGLHVPVPGIRRRGIARWSNPSLEPVDLLRSSLPLQPPECSLLSLARPVPDASRPLRHERIGSGALLPRRMVRRPCCAGNG